MLLIYIKKKKKERANSITDCSPKIASIKWKRELVELTKQSHMNIHGSILDTYIWLHSIPFPYKWHILGYE